MSLNQNAFNEGIASVAAKYNVSTTDIIKLASGNPLTWLGEATGAAAGGTVSGFANMLGVNPESVGKGALAAGVGIPAAAALWYKLNHDSAKKEQPAQSKEAMLGELAGAAGIGLPVLGALGAWQYLNYRKGQQNAGGDDVDSILNITPEGQHQVTHEPKSTTRPMKA